MSLLFPRLAYAPVRCSPVRREVAPLWSLFDDTLNELQRASRQTSRHQWNPRFDVKETKEAYSLEGELPGVDQKDINIEFVDEHTITIKGRHERRTERGQRPTEAVEATEATTAAVEDGTATPASEHSAQSHHATVEDDVEEPANSSAATAAEQPAAQEVTKASTSAETETAKPAEPQFWFRERSVGEFTRSFSFPSRVDQEAVRASLKNGILSIVVPKAPVPESRRVTIE